VSTDSARLLHELFLKAGVPAELFPMLPAKRETGAELIEADIDHVVFTGSAAVGRKIAARLGERLISSTLELSGCDAMFVLADADVEMAAKAAWFGATLNRGQTCIAVRRAFVQRSLYPAFVAAIQAKLDKSGPMTLVMPSQVDQADRLVGDARDKGGRVLAAPGDLRHPTVCVPRVVADATPEMALCREDCFAPLLAVLPFETNEEALCMDAACRYGLGSSVFAGNSRTASALASELRAGSVSINDAVAPTAHPATPFGGRGLSGWGVTQGPDGLLAMTTPQVVSVRGGKFRPHYEPTGGPNGPMHRMLQGLLAWRHAPGFGQRFRGFWRMVSGARAMRMR
jgi:acyl-CoA reductase-like NAD-dependent aldehyde dehydrogenase